MSSNTRPTRGRGRWTSPRLWVPLATSAAVTVMLLLAMLGSTWPLISPDTGGYLIPPERFLAPPESSQQDFTVPLTAWGGLSFLGNAYREWPTTLLYVIGAHPFGMSGRVLLQIVIALLAYGLFCLAAWRAFSRPVALGATLIVAAVMLTSTGVTHALTIGPESLAFSMCLVALAAALLAVTPSERSLRSALVWGSVSLIAGFVAANTRFTLLPVFLIAAGAVLLVAWRQRGRTRSLVALGLLVAVVVGVGWSVLVQHNRNLVYGQVSDQAYRVFYQLHPTLNAFSHDAFQAALPADAPACLRDFPDERMSWDRMTEYGIQVCGPDGIAWINDNYTRVMVGYYLGHPVNSMKYFTYNSVYASSPWSDPRVWTPLPVPLDEAFFSSADDRSNVSFLGLGAAVLLLVLMPVAIVRRRRSGRPVAMVLLLSGAVVLLWTAFFLSYADHPEAAARKSWPACPIALTTTLWAVGAMLSRDPALGVAAARSVPQDR